MGALCTDRIGLRFTSLAVLVFFLFSSLAAYAADNVDPRPRGAGLMSVVWEDVNRDAMRDKKEPGVPGIIVALFDCDARFITATVSDRNGRYSFVDLAEGCYRVRFDTRGNFRFCPAGIGGDERRDSDADPATGLSSRIDLEAFELRYFVDAGIVQPDTAALGDRVWEDVNADGRQDIGEPGLADVTVDLLDCAGNSVLDLDGTPRRLLTDTSGFFVFSGLPADCYQLAFAPGPDYLPTYPDMTAEAFDSDLDPATGTAAGGLVSPSLTTYDIDAGFYRNGTIGDFIWLDRNGDGVQDGNEPGVPGVQVLLLDADAIPTGRTAVSNGKGYYEFRDVMPGRYRIQYIVPEPYHVTSRYQGDDANRDNDANSLGTTAPFELVSAGQRVDLDLGLNGGVAIGISIEKMTNGEDADVPPGPFVAAGDPVLWEYIVANIGLATLFEIAVTDDQGVSVTCPGTILQSGISMICTGSTDSAQTGQYINVASVCGNDQTDDPTEVCNNDASHYFGAVPAVTIETLTNGNDADLPPGPGIPVGDVVNWEYVVTNSGNVPLTDIVVTDDQGVTVTCPSTTLDPGVVMTCVATGSATPGQYANVGSVVAVPPAGPLTVEASDPSHYNGQLPSVTIETLTNGEDSDQPPGEGIFVGDAVNWDYVVTNDGATVLNNIVVTDDQGVTVSCPSTTLAAGASMTCTASGTASAGQYANVGTVVAVPPAGPATVQATDPSHYFGVDGRIRIEKRTNGMDADNPPGPTIGQGETLTWEYEVFNEGNVEVTDLTVTDSQGVVVSCPATTIGVGASVVCTGSAAAVAGPYMNLGTACVLVENDRQVCDDDPSHYTGVAPGIDIDKFTQAQDADTAPGPVIIVGDGVSWSYLVTNTGGTELTDIAVTDDQGVVVSCPGTTLAPGTSFVCTGQGVATQGQYMNIGEACGMGAGGQVCATDPSHYIGREFSIDIEKTTNGVDADVAPGPAIAVGEPVTWTYTITNTGELLIAAFTVEDDQGVTITCPPGVTSIAAGDSVVCTATGTAVAGPYENLGTVCGLIDEAQICDEDPSHYFGADSQVQIEKMTNGVDADTAPGPMITEDDPVNWSYVVTNTGNVTLNNIAVSDDQGVTVTCPGDTLAPGASLTCTGSGIAVPGQYMNIGTVTAQGVDDGGQPVGAPATDSDPSHYFGDDIPAATIGDLFFTDNDRDGVQGPGDGPVVGATVNLWTDDDGDGTPDTLVRTVVTDGNGNYLFADLDPRLVYLVEFVPLPGQTLVDADQGADDIDSDANPATGFTAPITLTPGETNLSIDAGVNVLTGSLSIEKSTNDLDADFPTGQVIAIGEPIAWTYRVENTGELDLIDLVVSDDQGVTVSCPVTTLAPGASTVCTGSGTATAGQYRNVGSATAQPADGGTPVGAPVDDDDPSHYFGGAPTLTIEKSTNGADADVAPGPIVLAGDTVNWTYVVTNTGNIDITDIAVSDDQGVTVSCPGDTLTPGSSLTCTASGPATAGQYMNIGTATGQGVDGSNEPVGVPVSADDPSHYFGTVVELDIEKLTNGEDADSAPGPFVSAGDVVTWTYVVTNSGNSTVTGITVSDSQGVTVSCPSDALAPGATLTCTGTGAATPGQYMNVGSATGQPVDDNGNPVGPPVTVDDPSHYFGFAASLAIEKSTNGSDADAAPGPSIIVGAAVDWTYSVTNTGNVTINGIAVSDSQGVTVSCPSTTLAPGATLTCTGSGVATAGQYMNIGSVSGQPVDDGGNPVGPPVADDDPSHYFGSVVALDIEKLTNGEDADAAPGPTILAGDAVSWTYVLTNQGNSALANVAVSDSQGVTVTCPSDTLAAGATMTCTGSGVATAGQYMNVGSATAQPVDENGNPVGPPVSGDDPSHYFGAVTSLDIEKLTNGQDADVAPGPAIVIGAPVEWTYVVTNTGNLTVTGIAVVDSQSVTVSCPSDTLAAGATLTCTGSGVATGGQYMNLGTVTGQPVDDNGNPVGPPVSGDDPSHYFGSVTGLNIEKMTNGQDADVAPGPAIVVGAPVEWTYVVTNTSNLTVTGISVSDSQGVTVTCPSDTLAPGATLTCTGSGVATSGQYMNIGTVTGQPVDDNGNPVGPPVSGDDPSHYFGSVTGLNIEKMTNGQDADAAPGPAIVVGAPVEWTYVVTNTSNLTVSGISVSDSQGVTVTCPSDTLAPGATLTCTGSGIAMAGQYMNIGTVTGQPVDDNGNPVGPTVSGDDPSHYFGSVTGLNIEKMTNGQDADAAPGPAIVVGAPVEWTYVVTNTSNLTVTGISVSDSQGVTVTCPSDTLAPGATLTCTGSGIAMAGQYMNIGTVTGQPVDDNGDPVGPPVSGDDPSHYFGSVTALDIQKMTNGQDADAAPGPAIVVGAAVEWTYLITNTGNLTVTGISVSDSQGVTVSCPTDTLASGATLICTGSGVATAGQYMNIGTVNGQPVDDNGNPVGPPVSGSDPSHYFGSVTALDIEKMTNGVDADVAPGPAIVIGAPVEWTYVVTNTSNLTVTGISVSDSQGVTVTCPSDTLAPGATLTCTGSGAATSGQYMNLGTVTGQPVDDNGNPVGPPVSGDDPSHYFGSVTGLNIEKMTNGQDADAAPGPAIVVGAPVEWTYVVTNTSNLTVTGISVSDSQGVTVTCPSDTLAPGATLTCTGSGVATAGQYMNLGTVSGQPVDDNGNPVGPPVSGSDPSHYFGDEVCVDGDVADHFGQVSYGNNDGSMDWAGPWMEQDPQGGGAAAGNILIEDGRLSLNDFPNSDDTPNVYRTVDLTGFTAALLTFDWATTAQVDPTDTATLEISSDGGVTWSTLMVFTGNDGANAATEFFDISAWISATTTIRFSIAQKFGSAYEAFLVDNVRIQKFCDAPDCQVSAGPNHALWLPNFNNNGVLIRFDLDPGAIFSQEDDGTGQITGTVRAQNDPSQVFVLDVVFAGRTDIPPPGSPKNGFGADTSDWVYYPEWSGTLSGVDDYAGASVSFSRRGPSFQVGTGANDQDGDQNVFGASAWFNFETLSQAASCSASGDNCLASEGHGDINVRLDCPVP